MYIEQYVDMYDIQALASVMNIFRVTCRNVVVCTQSEFKKNVCTYLYVHIPRYLFIYNFFSEPLVLFQSTKHYAWM